MQLRWKKDYLAGFVVAAIGAFAVLMAQNYRMGGLAHVGPGFFPVVVGVLMIGLGAAIAGSASVVAEAPGAEPKAVDWRGWACVVGGPTMFIIAGHYVGLAPATFACVFVAALGDRTATWRSAAALAAIVAFAGVVLFAYVLRVPFPVFRLP